MAGLRRHRHASRWHEPWGWDRQLREEPQLCSICEAVIAPDDVPLQMFGPERPDGDCYAWIYCDDCSTDVIRRTMPTRASA